MIIITESGRGKFSFSTIHFVDADKQLSESQPFMQNVSKILSALKSHISSSLPPSLPFPPSLFIYFSISLCFHSIEYITKLYAVKVLYIRL